MGMYFECKLKKIDIDEVLSNVRYIEPEDLVVLYREKIRRLESALKNSEDGAEKLMTENERLKEELKLVQGDNCELREAVMTANIRNGVLTKRNRELKQQLDELEAIHEKDVNKLRADLAESHINSMELAGDLVFAEVRLEKANKKLLNSRFGLQSMPYHDLMMENRRLLQEQASLETQINILNAVSDGYKDDIGKLMHENEKLKTENKQLLKENKDLKESVKKLKEEREILSTKQVYFEDQINTLNATCEGYADNLNAYRKDVDQLTQENKKLIEERDALWAETQHLDKIYKQLLNEKKRLQENFEELKASSDLSMTAELAEIFAEFIDKNDKNRDDLSAKIDEFREKYQSE
jgi:chromosome segregation ATPase